MSNMKNTNVKKLVGTAVLTAIVIILQLLGSFIKFGPFSISLVLVPVVIGAAMYGVFSGAWLGFVFGATVLLSGDAALFLAINPLATVLLVIVKGTAAGAGASLLYQAFETKSRIFATFLAAFACPVVNTGVFIGGCYLFFMEGIEAMAVNLGFEGSVSLFIFTVLIGANFIFEVLVNVVLAPVIIRIVKIGSKRIR